MILNKVENEYFRLYLVGDTPVSDQLGTHIRKMESELVGIVYSIKDAVEQSKHLIQENKSNLNQRYIHIRDVKGVTVLGGYIRNKKVFWVKPVVCPHERLKLKKERISLLKEASTLEINREETFSKKARLIEIDFKLIDPCNSGSELLEVEK